MDEIPETWPPRPSADQESTGIPLFPLAGVFLYPHQLMPLHVFEPRYLEMMRDILDSHGQLVVGTLLNGQETAAQDQETPPKVLSVAGIGEVARYDKTKDGRYLIWVLGRGRVTIEEAPSDKPYRMVHHTPLPESSATSAESSRLDADLRAAVIDRHKSLEELPEDLPLGVLVDLLAQQLEVPQEILERIFCEPDLEARAHLALGAHRED